MNIGIIGSGEMGTCLALKLMEAGHAVSMANSRGPESLRQLADATGVEPTTVEKVVQNKQVVIVSIHEKHVEALPKHLFEDLPSDVVVIDTGNYYPNLRGGHIPALDDSGIDSLWVQEQLGVPVVKVFNAILATSLRSKGKVKGGKGRIALAVSGDKAKAKEVVGKLVEEMGFDPYNMGSIAQSWRQQPGSSIYCRDISLDELKRRVEKMGTEETAKQAVIAKRKRDEVLMATNYPAYLATLQDS